MQQAWTKNPGKVDKLRERVYELMLAWGIESIQIGAFNACALGPLISSHTIMSPDDVRSFDDGLACLHEIGHIVAREYEAMTCLALGIDEPLSTLGSLDMDDNELSVFHELFGELVAWAFALKQFNDLFGEKLSAKPSREIRDSLAIYYFNAMHELEVFDKHGVAIYKWNRFTDIANRSLLPLIRNIEEHASMKMSDLLNDPTELTLFISKHEGRIEARRDPVGEARRIEIVERMSEEAKERRKSKKRYCPICLTLTSGDRRYCLYCKQPWSQSELLSWYDLHTEGREG